MSVTMLVRLITSLSFTVFAITFSPTWRVVPGVVEIIAALRRRRLSDGFGGVGFGIGFVSGSRFTGGVGGDSGGGVGGGAGRGRASRLNVLNGRLRRRRRRRRAATARSRVIFFAADLGRRQWCSVRGNASM